MKRRQALALGVAGLAAGAAGLGWQGLQARRAHAQLEAATGGLWSSRFERPEGGVLDMATLRGRPLLLNFWATWCPPCIEEMPDLDRFARSHADRGWQVVGLAVDGPTPVRQFLARRPVGFAIGLAGFDGTELSKRLGNSQGALPFTAAFDREGRLVHRKLGQTRLPDLEGWAASIG